MIDGVMVDNESAAIQRELLRPQRGELEEIVPGITIRYSDSDPFWAAVILRDGRGVLRIDCISWRSAFTARFRQSADLMELLYLV